MAGVSLNLLLLLLGQGLCIADRVVVRCRRMPSGCRERIKFMPYGGGVGTERNLHMETRVQFIFPGIELIIIFL